MRQFFRLRSSSTAQRDKRNAANKDLPTEARRKSSPTVDIIARNAVGRPKRGVTPSTKIPLEQNDLKHRKSSVPLKMPSNLELKPRTSPPSGSVSPQQKKLHRSIRAVELEIFPPPYHEGFFTPVVISPRRVTKDSVIPSPLEAALDMPACKQPLVLPLRRYHPPSLAFSISRSLPATPTDPCGDDTGSAWNVSEPRGARVHDTTTTVTTTTTRTSVVQSSSYSTTVTTITTTSKSSLISTVPGATIGRFEAKKPAEFPSARLIECPPQPVSKFQLPPLIKTKSCNNLSSYTAASAGNSAELAGPSSSALLHLTPICEDSSTKPNLVYPSFSRERGLRMSQSTAQLNRQCDDSSVAELHSPEDSSVKATSRGEAFKEDTCMRSLVRTSPRQSISPNSCKFRPTPSASPNTPTSTISPSRSGIFSSLACKLRRHSIVVDKDVPTPTATNSIDLESSLEPTPADLGIIAVLSQDHWHDSRDGLHEDDISLKHAMSLSGCEGAKELSLQSSNSTLETSRSGDTEYATPTDDSLSINLEEDSLQVLETLHVKAGRPSLVLDSPKAFRRKGLSMVLEAGAAKRADACSLGGKDPLALPTTLEDEVPDIDAQDTDEFEYTGENELGLCEGVVYI